MTDVKEYFLERFLKELFHRQGEGFVLKGGMGMRALFGDNRRTKDIDLDFTNPKRTAMSLHKSIERALDAAARWTKAKDVRISKPSQGEQSPRWKVNFSDASGQTHHVEIEVSRDAERAPPAAPVQVRYQPMAGSRVAPFFVDIYDPKALIATKLAALLGRQVPAPRDVFDLDALLATSEPPSDEQVQWALRRAGIKPDDARGLVEARMEEMSWAIFASQLLDSLPDADAERMSADEWDAMKSRVAEALQALLP